MSNFSRRGEIQHFKPLLFVQLRKVVECRSLTYPITIQMLVGHTSEVESKYYQVNHKFRSRFYRKFLEPWLPDGMHILEGLGKKKVDMYILWPIRIVMSILQL
jgi:hypothetical protein